MAFVRDPLNETVGATVGVGDPAGGTVGKLVAVGFHGTATSGVFVGNAATGNGVDVPAKGMGVAAAVLNGNGVAVAIDGVDDPGSAGPSEITGDCSTGRKVGSTNGPVGA